MVLFAGDNLDNWIALSGQWGVRDRAMTCLAAPALIRSTYESDEFILRFQYRRASKGENLLAVHSKMTTGGIVFRLSPQGLVPSASAPAAAGYPDDTWIDVTVQVGDGKVLAEHQNTGPSDTERRTPQPTIVPVPAGSRGFVRFQASEPGLEIRNVRVDEPGFRNLFDGRTLAGWDIVRPGNPDSPGWFVENGVLRCKGAGSGWLRTLETYDNFILRVEYQLPPRGNSGIYVRAPLEGRVSRNGLEIQLLDDLAYRGRFRPAQFAGSVYDGIAPEVRVPAPADQWNAMEVLLDGKRIRTVLNGTQLYDARLDDASKDVNHDKRPLSTRRLTGFLGFQEHTTPVRFRNVRLRELDGP